MPAFFLSCSNQDDTFVEALVLSEINLATAGSMWLEGNDSIALSDFQSRSLPARTLGPSLSCGQGIKTLDVFVFNDDALRRLDSYEHLTDVDGDSILAFSTTGPKVFVVLANCPPEILSFTGLMCYEDLAGIKMRWEDDSAEYPFMSGEVSLAAGSRGQVLLRDLCSVVCVDDIIASGDFVPTSVHLENLNRSCEILGDTPSRPVEYVESSEVMEYSPGVELRCYPNSSNRESIGSYMTELVIDGMQGETSRSFRIKVNGFAGLKRNTRYSLKLSVSPDPVGTVVESGYLSLFPGNILTGHDGDSLRVWVEVYPEDAPVVFDREDLEFDKDRGIYDYRVDPDGKGVTLYLLRGGTGMFCIDAGPPVNDGCLVIVVCNP